MPNYLEATGLLLTNLTRQQNEWVVEVHGRIEVTAGALDALSRLFQLKE